MIEYYFKHFSWTKKYGRSYDWFFENEKKNQGDRIWWKKMIPNINHNKAQAVLGTCDFDHGNCKLLHRYRFIQIAIRMLEIKQKVTQQKFTFLFHLWTWYFPISHAIYLCSNCEALSMSIRVCFLFRFFFVRSQFAYIFLSTVKTSEPNINGNKLLV